MPSIAPAVLGLGLFLAVCRNGELWTNPSINPNEQRTNVLDNFAASVQLTPRPPPQIRSAVCEGPVIVTYDTVVFEQNSTENADVVSRTLEASLAPIPGADLTFCMAVYSPQQDLFVSSELLRNQRYGHWRLFDVLLDVLAEHFRVSAILGEQKGRSSGADFLFVDVGSNLGFHSLQAMQRGVSRVVSVEAQSGTFALLKETRKRNWRRFGGGGGKRWRLIHRALVDADFVAKYRWMGSQPSDFAVMRSHEQSPGMTVVEAASKSESEEVSSKAERLAAFKWRTEKMFTPVATLDQVFHFDTNIPSSDSAGRVAFLKVDVEGVEASVLRGGFNFLSTTKPFVVHVEIFPALLRAAKSSPQAVLEELWKLKYRRFFLGVGDALLDWPTIEKLNLPRMQVGPPETKRYVAVLRSEEEIAKFSQSIMGEPEKHFDILTVAEDVPATLNLTDPGCEVYMRL